jgi:co-chaperonin GroES (HSP10)
MIMETLNPYFYIPVAAIAASIIAWLIVMKFLVEAKRKKEDETDWHRWISEQKRAAREIDKKMMAELSKAMEPTWFEVGPVKFSSVSDRIIIEEDEFKSGYECQKCAGRGEISCDNCLGAGRYLMDAEGKGTERKCSLCNGTGKVRCPDCDGKGGTIVLPEVSMRRPTTGRVVSAGEKCKRIKVGMDVLYTSFAGHMIELQNATVLRILREDEVLCILEGHLEFKMAKRNTTMVPV